MEAPKWHGGMLYLFVDDASLTALKVPLRRQDLDQLSA